MLPILLLNSCYKSTEWEEVTADYDPVLNVIGIISLDGNIENFVEVYPTIDLTSLSMELVGYDSTFIYYTGKRGEIEDLDGGWVIEEIFKPANIIDSATVQIFTETDTFLFNYDENDGKYKNSDFQPFPDSLYNLSVEVNGFDPVTGALITPSIPSIDSTLIDTISSSSTYAINWDEQESGNHGLIMGELVDSYVYCGGNFYDVVEFASEEYTVFPQWCDPEQVSIGEIDNDYGIMSESNCMCDIYRIWDQTSETCICTNDNPPVLEDSDEEVSILGDCESAVNAYGCDHVFDDGTFLNEYCPETCDECSSVDIMPLENRNWTRFDLSYVRDYLGVEIDLLQTDYGYCGDGSPDYETLQIRLMAVDDNYYEYFATERFKDFSNFLFETEGTVGQSVGIEGGFGVFGAFASDTLTRVLSP